MCDNPSIDRWQQSRRYRRRRVQWPIKAVLPMALLVCGRSSTTAFNVDMQYKPPVKTSVSKIYDRRYGSSPSSASTSGASPKSGTSTSPPTPSSSASRRSSRAAAFAGSLAAPPPISPASTAAQSFERRMRDLVFGQQKREERQRASTAAPSSPPASIGRPASIPPNVHLVTNLRDYKKVVGDEMIKMVAVRFYAPYCKACKAMESQFYKLARELPSDSVVFVEVPVSERNASLHQGLGVPSIPFGHIYHPTAGLVEEQSILRKNMGAFRQSLLSYVEGSCDVLECVDEDHSPENISSEPRNLAEK